MMFAKEDLKKNYEPVVPMINVIFLLLIYFIVIGEMKPYEILLVNPPELHETGEAMDVSQMTLLIDSSGKMALDNKVVALEDLISKIEPSYGANYILIVKADKDLEATELLAIMKELKQTSFNKLHLLIV